MKKNQGFTLIETLVAIFLLTLTVGGLLTLAAGGYFSVRYSRNQIVATNLIQESLEFIRNSRDTAVQQGTSWAQWKANYSACFSQTGCLVDPYATSGPQVRACTNGCDPVVFYPGSTPPSPTGIPGFYGYAKSVYPVNIQSATPSLTSYVRTITMVQAADPNQITATSTITWLNGNNKQTNTQSVVMTNWNND